MPVFREAHRAEVVTLALVAACGVTKGRIRLTLAPGERIEFDAAYDRAGRAVWASGKVATSSYTCR